MNKGIVFDFNRTLYDPDGNSLMPHALECLENLKQKGWRLFLIGKGTASRENLIHELGLDRFFEKIIVKEEKELADFENLKNTFQDLEFYSVGDRIKKEIVLSNTCNFKTIWFKNGKFATEEPEIPEEQPWKTIHDLGELEKALGNTQP